MVSLIWLGCDSLGALVWFGLSIYMVYPVDHVPLYHAMLPMSTMGIPLFRGGTNKFTLLGEGVGYIPETLGGHGFFLVAKQSFLA